MTPVSDSVLQNRDFYIKQVFQIKVTFLTL